MTNYLYSVESEPWKRALHHARVLGDRSLLREFGINGDGGKRDILSHAREYSDKYIRWYLANVPHGDADFVTLRRPQNLSRVQNLERLRAVQSLRDLRNLERLRIVQSLEGLRNLEKLEIRGGDYRDLPIPEGATVYADIPYRATSGYTEEGFDHAAFYDWCRTREFPVFVSEYHMPDDFVPLWKKHKTSTFAGSGRHKKTIECLFVHERFFDQTKTTLFGYEAIVNQLIDCSHCNYRFNTLPGRRGQCGHAGGEQDSRGRAAPGGRQALRDRTPR